jgi:hypothetical protein
VRRKLGYVLMALAAIGVILAAIGLVALLWIHR